MDIIFLPRVASTTNALYALSMSQHTQRLNVRLAIEALVHGAGVFTRARPPPVSESFVHPPVQANARLFDGAVHVRRRRWRQFEQGQDRRHGLAREDHLSGRVAAAAAVAVARARGPTCGTRLVSRVGLGLGHGVVGRRSAGLACRRAKRWRVRSVYFIEMRARVRYDGAFSKERL